MVDFKELYLEIISKFTEIKDETNDKYLKKIEEKLGTTLPKALREYYLIEDQIPIEQEFYPEIYITEVHFDGPDYDEDVVKELIEEVGEEEIKNYPNVLIVAEHTQGSVFWAIDVKNLKEEDPPILCDETRGGFWEWERTGFKCSEFICFMLYYNYEYLDTREIFLANAQHPINKKMITRIEDNYPLLYDYYDCKVYAKDGQVLKYFDNGHLRVTAKTEKDKVDLCQKLDAKWENDSLIFND
ncbi:MAG: SMI1/KNR4 family protein [Promethearchaeota archaeon]